MRYRITRIYQPEGACRPDRSDRMAVVDAETPRAALEAYQGTDPTLKDWTIEEKRNGGALAVLLNPVEPSDPIYTVSEEEPPKPWEPKRKKPPADTDADGDDAGETPDPIDSEGDADA